MTTKERRAAKLYGTFSLITLVSVYLLILVGGIVRSTGSGMGCPDWPKCFDQWTPPTSVDQLPADYKERYSDYRHDKNLRFAKYLRFFGMSDTADQLLNDESIREERTFNAFNTWVEYLNRLLGALIGFFILLTFLFSIPFFKKDAAIFYVALSTLLLVIFQGWLGSIVVSTNLVPWLITIHMLIAIIIVQLLVYLYHRSRKMYTSPWNIKSSMKSPLLLFLGIGMAIVLVQIILGTQVREQIDQIAAQTGENARDIWISLLNMQFIVHRSFSWLIVFLHGYLFYLLLKQGVAKKLMTGIFILILCSVITGVIMAYAGIPAFAQPVHLLLGTGIIGLQFLLFLQLKGSVELNEEYVS